MKKFKKNKGNAPEKETSHHEEPSKQLNSNPEDEITLLTPEPINSPDPQFNIETPQPSGEGIEKDWGSDKSSEGRINLRWFALLALAILGIALWLTNNTPNQKAKQPEKTTSFETSQLEELNSHQTLSAIKNCIQGYLSANTVAEISARSRNPERVQALMVNYYRRHSRPHLTFKSIAGLEATSIKGRPFLLVRSEVIDLDHRETKNSQHTSRSLILEQTGEFEFKVDWEVDVFHQPIPWSEYTHKRPLHPFAMRVLVSKDDFYAFAFRNSNHYQCYLLKVPGETSSLFAYAERGSPLESQINSLLTPNKKSSRASSPSAPTNPKKERLPDDDLFLLQGDIQAIGITKEKSNTPTRMTRPMILKLRFLREDASPRGVLIDSLVSENWVY